MDTPRRVRRIAARFPLWLKFAFLSGVLAVFSAGAVGLISVQYAERSLLTQAAADNDQRALLAASLVAQSIASSIEDVESLGRVPPVIGALSGRDASGPADVQLVAEGYLRTRPHLSALTVYLTRGAQDEPVAAVRSPRAAPETGAAYVIGTEPAFAAVKRLAFEQQSPAVGDVLVGPLTGHPVLPIAVPIRNYDGHVVGVTVAGVFLDHFSAPLTAAAAAAGHSGGQDVWVSDAFGRIAASQDPSRLLRVGPAFTREPSLFDVTGAPRSRRVAVDGQPSVVAYAPVPLTGWTVYSAQTDAAVLAPLSRLRSAVLFALAIVAASGALVAIAVARSVSHPVTQLARAARAAGTGDFGADVPRATADEIGVLADSFTTMRADIARLLDAERNARARAEESDARREAALADRTAAEREVLAINARLRQALADLESAQAQVVQQERLRALGQMASGIAHDFNNALAPIAGFSELLLAVPDALADEKKARKYLELIHTSAQDAAKVVDRLREFYRHRERKEEMEPTDLAALVRQVIDLTRPKWKDQAQAEGRTIDVETDLASDAVVHGSPAELRELLANLVLNAVDAMPRGGRLTLRCATEGADATIEVADTGIGMTEDERRRCLEPFFTTKGERGTGLGLAMAHGIVRRHGGSIEVRSAPGRGTTFLIRLPRDVEASERAGGAADAPQDAAAGGLRILLVDDEPVVRATAAALLEASRHRVTAVASGEEALSLLRAAGPAAPFDVVVTDRAMPGMNGDRLAKAVKDWFPGLPVVLASGYGSLMNHAGELPAYVDVVLAKPFQRDALERAVRRAIGGAGVNAPGSAAAA